MPVRSGDIARSLAFYLAFYGGTLGFVAAAFAAGVIGPEPFARVVDSWARYHRWCVERLLGIRVAVEGTMPQGPVLVAVKHESFFEAIDTPVLMHRPAAFPKVELVRIPLWGRAARTYGVVVVEREEGAKALRAMIAAARVYSAQGRPLVIFPEGTRVPHGQRAPLQSGFAGLYKLIGLPVVPIAVDSGPLYHRRWKRPGTITYRVGETIAPGLPREEIEARVLDAINALNG
ncbi:lysophospholipid acyltransferase family protein [Novosphingobium album (ex Liu et al. 2023)]|uniref:Lysophospholipid acyltransferase family protein n=1 Tax=Novosphingobium album (ex Liu et al. 2023) TaxID=3031130 RepID=A0ABT5WR49_9SPHN|nr:lysophospholipid acyltransferase family protein [Novosphingobium album (ex Liu et al. 2023)]MDE8652501.1 lysophospholipid acyltransferase family protein [Novosphingobium album (ex Liu et al. 2023)]